MLDLDQIYREHGHVVLRRARKILGDEVEAREVLQEVFLSLVAKPAQFRGRSSITTFLYRVTTNRCLNRLRDQRRRGELSKEGASAGSPITRADDAFLAREVLAGLPARLARVAVHHYVDEMTHEEISELLGVSRRQVGNLVAKANELARNREAAA